MCVELCWLYDIHRCKIYSHNFHLLPSHFALRVVTVHLFWTRIHCVQYIQIWLVLMRPKLASSNQFAELDCHWAGLIYDIIIGMTIFFYSGQWLNQFIAFIVHSNTVIHCLALCFVCCPLFRQFGVCFLFMAMSCGFCCHIFFLSCFMN